MFPSERQKRLSYAVFGIYFILLVWLVLFKFSTSFSDLPNIRSINLIPLYYDQQTSTHGKEVFFNIIVFIPLGIYVQVFRHNWNIITKWTVAVLTSLLLEVIQFIFAIGASDITDLIGNTLGGMLGILSCMMLKKIAPKKFISIINLLGMCIEIIAIGLLVLLLVVN
jgi:glycopeptide antibiotics resistance protein